MFIIKDEFFIDTNNFKVNKTNINFWIREKNYNKRRLSISCQNLTETETFKVKQTQSNPIPTHWGGGYPFPYPTLESPPY